MEFAILPPDEAQKIIEGRLMRLHMLSNTSKWRLFKANHPIEARKLETEATKEQK